MAMITEETEEGFQMKQQSQEDSGLTDAKPLRRRVRESLVAMDRPVVGLEVEKMPKEAEEEAEGEEEVEIGAPSKASGNLRVQHLPHTQGLKLLHQLQKRKLAVLVVWSSLQK